MEIFAQTVAGGSIGVLRPLLSAAVAGRLAAQGGTTAIKRRTLTRIAAMSKPDTVGRFAQTAARSRLGAIRTTMSTGALSRCPEEPVRRHCNYGNANISNTGVTDEDTQGPAVNSSVLMRNTRRPPDWGNQSFNARNKPCRSRRPVGVLVSLRILDGWNHYSHGPWELQAAWPASFGAEAILAWVVIRRYTCRFWVEYIWEPSLIWLMGCFMWCYLPLGPKHRATL